MEALKWEEWKTITTVVEREGNQSEMDIESQYEDETSSGDEDFMEEEERRRDDRQQALTGRKVEPQVHEDFNMTELVARDAVPADK